MSLSVGILGLPNVGKSTLFKSLTQNSVDISNYPFCTKEPNVGIVEVPDERLFKLDEVSPAKKALPAVIKFVDIAGLVKGAAQGEGLGNQFLSHIRETDVLIHVIRCFKSTNIAHIEEKVDPERDIEIINKELIQKDLETVKKHLEKIGSDVRGGEKQALKEKEILDKIRPRLEKGETVFSFLNELTEEEKQIIENLFLLTFKPQIYLLNGDKKEVPEKLKNNLEKKNISYIQINTLDELEKQELTKKERKELGISKDKLKELIKTCYKTLNLITFFTIRGNEETRAWPIEKGSTVYEAAGIIHSDFQEKFISAEVLNWEKVTNKGSWKKCKEEGLVKRRGKDYILKDGDVVEIKV